MPIVVVLSTPTPPADPGRFAEAVAAWKAKKPTLAADFDKLTQQQRQRAFTVAGVAQASILADVWKALDKAVADGTTFADFKKDVATKLTAAWGGPNPARLETIFRTNVQTAYIHGRYAAMTQPLTLKRRPFWKYSAIKDSRTTSICSALDGKVLPADSDFWNTHIPPLHFSCRSQIIALTAAQAEAAGVSEPPEVQADDGFGLAPGRGGDELKPDLSTLPAPLAAVVEKKLEKLADAAAPAMPLGSPQELQRRLDKAAPDVLGAELHNQVPVQAAPAFPTSARHTDGKVEIHTSIWPAVHDLLTTSDRTLDEARAKALLVVVHENIHGLGQHKAPGSASDGYRSALKSASGRALEEGSTELLSLLKLPKLAKALGLKLPPGVGYERAWKDGRLTSKHAYVPEVGMVESLLHFASGTAKATAAESGNLTAAGVDLLTRMAGQWKPEKRAQMLAALAVEKSGPSTDAPRRRQLRADVLQELVHRLGRATLPQPEIHRLLHTVLNADDATLDAMAQRAGL